LAITSSPGFAFLASIDFVSSASSVVPLLSAAEPPLTPDALALLLPAPAALLESFSFFLLSGGWEVCAFADASTLAAAPGVSVPWLALVPALD
jgi:hypothetical protein